MSLIKNTPDEYFDKAIELMDQHFRDANYSENAVYYDQAGRCLDLVSQAQKDGAAWIAQAFEELRRHGKDVGGLINPTGEITISRTGTLLSVTLQGNALDNVLQGGPIPDRNVKPKNQNVKGDQK